MRELEWQLLIKSFSMAVGSRRLILRSPTKNTWSDWEVDDKNFIKFYCKLLHFWFLWLSVNTNNNYGAIVGNRNPSHTKLIICMTHWKIGHMYRCITISDKHRDTAYWFVSTVSLNITTSVGKKPRFWQHNNVSDTSATRNSDALYEWNSSKFLPNERMFSCKIKKIPTWDLTTLLKVEVVKDCELSTLLLSNSIAIFGAFVGDQH